MPKVLAKQKLALQTIASKGFIEVTVITELCKFFVSTGSDLQCRLYNICMSKKHECTLHKVTKQLQREQRHYECLQQNLANTQIERDSRKQVLKLRTEQAYQLSKS